MNKEILNNPIIQSLNQIHKHEIIVDFVTAYVKAQEILGDAFEGLMAELSVSIIELQSKAKKGTTLLTTALLLMLPYEDDEEEYDENYHLFMKAATIWTLLNVKDNARNK